jgi:hypothetical protein
MKRLKGSKVGIRRYHLESVGTHTHAIVVSISILSASHYLRLLTRHEMGLQLQLPNPGRAIRRRATATQEAFSSVEGFKKDESRAQDMMRHMPCGGRRDSRLTPRPQRCSSRSLTASLRPHRAGGRGPTHTWIRLPRLNVLGAGSTTFFSGGLMVSPRYVEWCTVTLA